MPQIGSLSRSPVARDRVLKKLPFQSVELEAPQELFGSQGRSETRAEMGLGRSSRVAGNEPPARVGGGFVTAGQTGPGVSLSVG